jgi:penicillin-binding protein 1A
MHRSTKGRVLKTLLQWLFYPILALAGLAVAGVAILAIMVILAWPQLPSLETITEYHPKVPLRIYTADGQLIGEFGEERRSVVDIRDVPLVLKHAILAAEDERFYEHHGVDVFGVARAAYANFVGGGRRQGASTITMQVARNFFLSSEKTVTRKFYEALLAFKIESSLSKDDILGLYINQIYLGQRSYGFAAASQIYYGKPLAALTAAEAAMLAGLPKAPSAYNPVVNPKRARIRQLYVLKRMLGLGHLTAEGHDLAVKQALIIKRDASEFGVHADYVAEMARQIAYERFQDDAYTRGYKVITTLVGSEQEAAYRALRKGVLDYDRRSGYRGAEAFVDLKGARDDDEETLEEALSDFSDSGELLAALVLDASAKKLSAYRRGGERVVLSGDALKFALRMLDDKAPATKRLRRGAIIRVVRDSKEGWQIAQLPEAEAAFVAADPRDGRIRALVGGFDFGRSKFNHVTLAWRQPGSSFKPFIYSAALEKGFTPATQIADEPIMVSEEETGSAAWEPKNYDGKYEGPMRMRTALAKSKNMVSIRILQGIGPQYAQDYAARFGFDPAKHPPYLTMALGAGAATPWQLMSAYAAFANGGYRVQPYIVQEIRDAKDQVIARATPVVAGEEELRIIDPRNAFLMDSMLRDVTIYGTAARASVELKRRDLAGKTGTTNDYVDAWFAGYQESVVGVAWLGFDQPRRLGNGETGGRTALPIWINYMATALKNTPESVPSPPPGLVQMDVVSERSKTGFVSEYFYQENVPVEVPAEPLGDGSRPID